MVIILFPRTWQMNCGHPWVCRSLRGRDPSWWSQKRPWTLWNRPKSCRDSFPRVGHWEERKWWPGWRTRCWWPRRNVPGTHYLLIFRRNIISGKKQLLPAWQRTWSQLWNPWRRCLGDSHQVPIWRGRWVRERAWAARTVPCPNSRALPLELRSRLK